MKNAKIVIWVIAAIGAVILGVVLFSPQGGSTDNVDDARMQELVAQGVRVVDVRTVGEYQMGRIPGSENVPMSDFQAAASGWNPAEPIVIYCATGSRSVSAVQHLEDQGFEQVYHFNAGIVAYSGQLEQGAQAVAQVPDTYDSPVLYEFYTDW